MADTDILMRFGADIEPLKKGAKAAQTQLDQVKDVAAKSAKSLVALGVAAAAAGTAYVAFSKTVADNVVELKNQATVANTSIAEFQRLAFAAETVGIESEKLSDILKDVNDRVGDFVQTGGGPMADFFENIAPLVGVTADNFKDLSGDQALKLYVDSLNAANLSQADMVFYMEAMASDSTQLLTLFADSGAELSRLEERYDSVNKQLAITSNQADSLTDLSETFSLLGETSANAATQVIGVFADPLNGFLSAWLDTVPKLTNMFVDFFNTFLDAEDINSISQINAQILKSEESIAEMRERNENSRSNALLSSIRDEKARLEQLQAQLVVLEQQDAARLSKVDEGSNSSTLQSSVLSQNEDEVVQISILNDEIMTLEEKKYQDLLDLQAEYGDQRAMNSEALGREMENIEKKYAESQIAISKAQFDAKMSLASGIFTDLSSLMTTENKKLFEIGKVAAIAEASRDGISAAISSYKYGASIGGPLAGAAAAGASLVSTGAMIASLVNTSYGGGSSTTSASSSAVESTSTESTSTEVEQTRSIRLESLDPNSLVSGAMVNSLAEQLVELQNDGFKLVV